MNCFQVNLGADTEPELVDEIIEFWRLFCRDVLPAADAKAWDHLAITMRGVDGNVGVYPDLVGLEPQEVVWGSIFIEWWQRIILNLPTSDDPTDMSYSNSVGDQNKRFAQLIVEAAQRADLPKLAACRQSGIRLRFHDCDEEAPFLDVIIDATSKDEDMSRGGR